MTHKQKITELKRLLKLVTKEYETTRKPKEQKVELYRNVIDFAREHNISGAAEIIESLVLERLGQSGKALELIDNPSLNIAGELKSVRHHIRGIILHSLKRSNEAITEIELALSDQNHDSIGKAHSALGTIYSDLNDHNNAIKHYEIAIQNNESDRNGPTLNNYANVFLSLGKFDRAIELYNRALDIPTYCNSHITKTNLAIALRATGKHADALKLLNEVLGDDDVENYHEKAKYLRGLVESDLATIKPSPEEEALVQPTTQKLDEYDTPEQRIVRKLQGLEDKYQEYTRRSPSQRDNTLSILRGWSSAVTLLEGGTGGRWQGGGYFLKWANKGIVIDPGFDFLDNFHDAGFHAPELDAVLVSHNHSDHNYDLNSLDDLRYEIFRRMLGTEPDGSKKPLLPKTLFVVDEDTAKSFRDDSMDHRGSVGKFTRFNSERKNWLGLREGLGLEIQHFEVQHGSDVPHAIGLRIGLYNKDICVFQIGYTADTKYFDGLSDHLMNCDLLIAHISQPDNQEFDNPEFYKSYHLGYNGVVRLINETKPKLTLIGEFWAGLADLRIDLIHAIRSRVGDNAVIPTGIGLHISLPELLIECTECKSPISVKNVRIAPPTSPFGPLGFLCTNCYI